MKMCGQGLTGNKAEVLGAATEILTHLSLSSKLKKQIPESRKRTSVVEETQ